MDLKMLWERRRGSIMFRERDASYRVIDDFFHSRTQATDRRLQLTYRPYLQDSIDFGSEEPSHLINHSRRVINHFTAGFSRRPKWVGVPAPQEGDDSEVKRTLANELTEVLEGVAIRSRLDTLQPRNSFFLSCRGDAVYGIDTGENGTMVRTFDPWWCYPMHSPLDIGACEDMLVCFSVPSEWAREKYKVTLRDSPAECQVFLYWDDTSVRVQVNDESVPSMGREHGFDCCPFRWVFGNGAGLMGQSDALEIPKLQELYNENILLAMDSIRRSVDPAYWGSGLKKDVVPKAGAVANAGPDAKINVFPTGGDPKIILGMASALESALQQTAGVSSISMSGQAEGSIVTGSAVRHQVEAIEARTETRKALLEDAFSELGSLILRAEGFEGATAQAMYGAFATMALQDRVRVGLEGVGRLWDDDYVQEKILDLPGVEAGDMVRRVRAYQIRQATTTAEAQLAAQKLAQQAQQSQGQVGGQQPGLRPQRPAKPPMTTASKIGPSMTSLAKVRSALQMVSSKLKGHVWAIEDLAKSGVARNPQVMVEKRSDLDAVQAILKGLRGMAMVGTPALGQGIQLA